VTAPLTLHGEDLFAASQSGFLYCLDRVTGGVKWSAPHQTPLLQAAVAAPAAVYQVRDGEMWSHDRADGRVNWKLPGATRFIAEREGKTYVESARGEVWQVGKDGKVTGKLAASAWRFLTNTKDGTLYAVTASGGIFKVEVGGE
jgi:outer membrane protein assembly factor BamB